MQLLIKTILAFLWIAMPGRQVVKTPAVLPKGRWRSYTYSDVFDGSQRGAVLLYHDPALGIANPLNYCILQQSEWILTGDDKSRLTSARMIPELFRPCQENNLEPDAFSSNVSTKIIFERGNFLCYKVRVDISADKGAPYIEYLNIDRKRNQPIHLADIIDATKMEAFTQMLSRYAMDHRKELVQHYQETLSEKGDPMLVAEQEVFGLKRYTLNLVGLSKQKPFLLRTIQPNGFTIYIDVTDRNFKPHANEYTSWLFLPKSLVKISRPAPKGGVTPP